jgi:hypothetical protein
MFFMCDRKRGQREDRERTERGQREDRERTERGQREDRERTEKGQREDRERTERGQREDRERQRETERQRECTNVFHVSVPDDLDVQLVQRWFPNLPIDGRCVVFRRGLCMFILPTS